MKKPFLLILAPLLWFDASAAYELPAHQRKYAEPCIRLILDCRYDQALSVTDSVISADTADPLAPLLRLAAIGIRDVDFDAVLDSAGFFRTYRLAWTRITAYEKKHGISSYSCMLKGFCKALHSSFFLRLQSYYPAMQNGFDALELLDQARNLDSTNTDALLFLGLYDYAKGELKKRLWWVLFWYPGSRDEGIKLLRSCEKNGRLTAEASRLALADIYIRENRRADAAHSIKRIGRDFPASRFALWAKAKYLESAGLHYEAALVFESISASYAATPAGRQSSLAARIRQARMLLGAGLRKEAAALCRDIMKAGTAKENNVIYKDAQKLLKRIEDADD